MSSGFWIASRIGWFAVFLMGVAAAGTYFAPEVHPGGLAIGLFYGALAPFALGRLVSHTAWKHRHSYRDPRSQLVINRSWFSSACYLVALLMLAGACVYGPVLNGPDDFAHFVGLLGLAAWALAVLAVSRSQISTALILSSEGLNYTPFKVGTIAWSDIRAAEIACAKQGYVIALHIPDEDKYIRRGFTRIPKWMKVFVPSLFMVPNATFGVSPKWLRTAIQVRLDHFGAVGRPTFQTVQRQGSH
jgi:hypothetical protein